VSTTEETLEGYGMRDRARCHVARPTSVAEMRAVFAATAVAGGSVGLRGAGRSYGDAALNAPVAGGMHGSAGAEAGAHEVVHEVVLDTSRMRRVLAYDAATGEITVEPGVTIADLWRHTLADGWWPPVVPGTSAVTLGGAAAANIHGKNNPHAGTLGDHLVRFDLLLPSGELVTCSREEHPDLFYGAVGGMGLLGCFTSLTLCLHRIASGLVAVRQTAHTSLEALLDAFAARAADETHLVGWADTGARGRALGRGLLKGMRELSPGEDPNPARSLDPAFQTPSARVAGVVPAAWVPSLARPLATPLGIRLANRAQWLRGNLPGAARTHREAYAPANFLLDYFPGFNRIYRPGGLLQHQCFVPRVAAPGVFRALLRRSHAAGLQPALAVLKRHRPSDFLLDYLCDGYSLALDYAVPRGREAATLALLRDLNALAADAGGRFYLAKDSTLTPDDFRRTYPSERLARFRALKARYDPDELLQTNIYRRVIRPALEAS
jgi:FAD/FMN-containing dehydrogenase